MVSCVDVVSKMPAIFALAEFLSRPTCVSMEIVFVRFGLVGIILGFSELVPPRRWTPSV